MTEIRFARSGDIDVAYRVVGDGPVDLVYAQGAYTHLEICWELPQFRRYCERLGEFTRLILFDKRGMGMSDRVPGATTLEERMDDIRAIMDAAGSERAAVMGESEGGPLAMLFAAAHPERTVALILQGAEVRERTDDDWPWGESTEEEFEEAMQSLPERWGQGLGFRFLAPSVGDVEWGRAWRGRVQTHANTPSSAEAFMRMAFDIDVRHVVPAINVPTLIVHAVEDQICHVENARFLARTIAGARYVELPGADHVPWFDPDATIAELREFLTGTREALRPDRALATVLFTDLVGSTEHAAEIGDRRWRDLLEQHHAAVRRELVRFEGREVDTAGDGSSPPSTVRRAGSGAPRRSSTACGRSGWRFAQACTRARSSSPTARWRASPSTSERASRDRRAHVRSSSQGPSRISLRDRGSSSRIAAWQRSRACPVSGSCLPSSASQAGRARG